MHELTSGAIHGTPRPNVVQPPTNRDENHLVFSLRSIVLGELSQRQPERRCCPTRAAFTLPSTLRTSHRTLAGHVSLFALRGCLSRSSEQRLKAHAAADVGDLDGWIVTLVGLMLACLLKQGFDTCMSFWSASQCVHTRCTLPCEHVHSKSSDQSA
jgi:hypothetical protein